MSAGSGLGEVLNTAVEVELGYPAHLIHHREQGTTYVKRACEGGCQRELEFTPLPGQKRFQFCSTCKRVTTWRVVA